MAVAGKSIMEHNEILGMDAALRFINQSVAHVSYFTLQVSLCSCVLAIVPVVIKQANVTCRSVFCVLLKSLFCVNFCDLKTWIRCPVVHKRFTLLQDILDIHRRVLGFVDPDAAGVFRSTQVGSFKVQNSIRTVATFFIS